MRELTAGTFDAELARAGDALAVVFFWGVDCFNCEVAKKTMLLQREAIEALNLRWYHANVYQERALGTRFALHGVPSFFFFHAGRKLGRATGWQGVPQFGMAVAAAREKIAAFSAKKA
ncbi:thioredoxin family protein [Pandoraea terrae]|nr:thioredoxin family protein [Pandoraea terrae]